MRTRCRTLLEEFGLASASGRAAGCTTSATCATARRSGCFSTTSGRTACCPCRASARTRWRQYRRFAGQVRAAQAGRALCHAGVPGTGLPASHLALNAITFKTWLDREGLSDPQLRWYLDYSCRDDYGAGIASISAWAGIHYFASRHGFHAPGDDAGEREGVLTWPEGNAWLTRKTGRAAGRRGRRAPAHRPRGAAHRGRQAGRHRGRLGRRDAIPSSDGRPSIASSRCRCSWQRAWW
jgi:hypothetical protein